MQKQSKISVVSLLTCLAFVLSLFGGPSYAQEKDKEKLLNEIAGDYEFEYEGQYIVFEITVEDGNLMAAPEGEIPDVLEPVDGEEMTYVGYSPDGMEYQFKFIRDDEGEITKCTIYVPAMGIEVEGTKIKG